jgi:hypothetical protein
LTDDFAVGDSVYFIAGTEGASHLRGRVAAVRGDEIFIDVHGQSGGGPLKVERRFVRHDRRRERERRANWKDLVPPGED